MKFQPSHLAIVLNIFFMRSLHIAEDQIKKSVKMDWKIQRLHKKDKGNSSVNMDFCAY